MDSKIINDDYTAVLLLAGYGSRINSVTNDPKCLLKVNDLTLLENNFRTWKTLGIKKVNLVLGYKKEMIEEVVAKYRDDFDFNISLNEDFRNHGNTFSLYLGIKDLNGPCLIFDGDLIYEKNILQQFLEDKNDSQILVGEGSLDDIESAKTLVDSNGHARMTIDKRAVSEEELSKYSFAGEAIGILKFSESKTKKLSEHASTFLSRKENVNLNWEHLLNEFLVENEIGTHMFTRGKWVEIDTPEDFAHAKSLFEAAK